MLTLIHASWSRLFSHERGDTMPAQNTVTLYRPTGEQELAPVRGGWKAFPPRLPDHSGPTEAIAVYTSADARS